MERADSLPGMDLFLQPVQDLTVEDRVSRTQYQLSVEALSDAQLEGRIPDILAALWARPELSHVTSDLLGRGRMLWLDIDRDAASRLGVSMDVIDNALYDALGQRLISTIFTQTNQYKVVLESAPQFRRGPDDIEKIYVTGSEGKPIPLSALVRMEERSARPATMRQGQFPVATISFNVAEGSSLGAAVSAVEETLASLELPSSLRCQFQGAAHAFASSTDNQVWLLLAAVAAWGVRRKVDVYTALTDGAAEGLRVVLRICPNLIALLSAVYMLRASGALDFFTSLLAPVLTAIGIPPETAPLLLIRPLSGSGALAAGSELMAAYGVDSTVGRTAAVMLGCTETTFYTIAVYFGAAGVRKIRYTIPAALTADFVGFLAAAWCVRLFF